MTKPQKSLLEQRTVSISELVPNPRNPNTHPRLQLDRLAASIKRFGQPRPVLVRAQNMMIIAGHGVWEAMKDAGHKQIAVILWYVDQKTADAYMLADNRFSQLSAPDNDRVAEILREIDEAEREAVGYSPEEANEVLAALEAEAIEVEELDTDLVSDRFWISIRGPLAQQAFALRRLKELMADIPDVEVDLGTVTGI